MPELKDLLAEVDAIQQATRQPIRAGAMGGEVYAAAEAAIAQGAASEAKSISPRTAWG